MHSFLILRVRIIAQVTSTAISIRTCYSKLDKKERKGNIQKDKGEGVKIRVVYVCVYVSVCILQEVNTFFAGMCRDFFGFTRKSDALFR